MDSRISPWNRMALWVATGLGVGYIPWASGTFGTLWGVLLFYLGRQWGWPVFALFTLGILLLALISSHYAEQALNRHDSSVIVIDEVAGYLVAVVGVPFSFRNAIIAFILFRLFDIWKPPPIRLIDQKGRGAWGVVMDDVVAGVFANLVLRGILYFVN